MTDNQIGSDAATRILDEPMDAMRREIADAGGREVFFAGLLDPRGLLESVRVCARGDARAVPAVMEALQPGEVVLHNHPSDDLAPSEADLDVASVCGHHGHGCYIVDNAVTRVYVLVEPFLPKDIHALDPQKLAKFFAPDGALADRLPGFEVRPQQARMMTAVARAFNHDGIAIVEAPTGVGKTMAYLFPAVLWALENKERVVVSTRTINLQEQIIQKDLPLLRKCLGKRFDAVLVKGRRNYLCRRRFEQALSEAALFADESEAKLLGKLAEWVEKTEDGSTSDLPFVPPRNVWDKVCSEVDTCLGMRCPKVKTCFLIRARREVARADLLVVNHHMLFSDVAVKKDIGDFSALGVLPAYKRLILDEAHSIEDSATEYFGVQATRLGALALIGRFVRAEHGRERGLLPYILLKLTNEVQTARRQDVDAVSELIYNSFMPVLAAAREALGAAFDALRKLAGEHCNQIGHDIKWRLTPEVLKHNDVRDVHKTYIVPAVDETVKCADICKRLHTLLKAIPAKWADGEPPMAIEMAQLSGYSDRLVRLGNVLAEATSPDLDPKTVRWIEIDAHRPAIVRVARCPLEVGEALNEWVYEQLKTVVMTSATLAVRRKFDYFFGRTGLD
ncbi:MAG TPA: DEAD/DEAH box helicase, partial [Candidatus Hydrogenedentes bacterium]|nr:DEAD/DEAH box helicase [Candidatus Hydrogenedentota bacterium]